MLPEYLQKHYTPDTAKAYQREIAIYLSNYPAADTAVYKDITTYIGLLRSRYSKASTLSRIVSSIKVYYDYLCSQGVRDDNPARAIKLRDKQTRDIQLQDLFTTDELEALLNRTARYHYLDYRNKVLMSLLIYQGLHPRDMEALLITDIDVNTGNMYIKQTAKTNGRTLQLKPNQVLLFYEYIHEVRNQLLQGNSSNALLIGLRGTSMKAEDITKHVKRSFKETYPGRTVNAQTIRQSIIANLLKQGHDVSIVQAFAGHKYPSATQRYRQHEVETLKAAVNKYHPWQ